MGFIINNNIQTSFGNDCKEAYVTIMGQYHIGRKEMTEVNPDPQFLIDNGYNVIFLGFQYVIYTTASIFISKSAYQNRKIPIIQNINIEENISLSELESSENIYDFIYSKLKDKVNSMFGNNLTFSDDI